MVASELAGQVAIVTGSGRGIGRAIAQAFAAAGAAVMVTARTESEVAETATLIEQAGGRALAFAADLTADQVLPRLVAETEQQLGPVDVLVNNAGVLGPVGQSWEVDPDTWWRCIDVNLRGPLLGAHAVLPGMVARGRGRIINVSSGAGLRMMAYNSSYTASKTALIRLTESLAHETRDYGIAVFVIGPGLVHTAMPASIAASEAGQKWMPNMGENLLHAVPVQRPASLCVYLASGAADTLSGRYLSVNDDVPDLIARAEQIGAGDFYTLRLANLPPIGDTVSTDLIHAPEVLR